MITLEDLEIVAGCMNIIVGWCTFETQDDYIYEDKKCARIRVLNKKHWYVCMRKYNGGFRIKQKE